MAEHAGLSARAISDLERGLRRAPHRSTVARLASALGLAQDEHAALNASVVRLRNGAPAEYPAPTRLSVPLTSFVGREQVADEVSHHVETSRLVTLAGPPGIGKTRLALHVAAALAGNFDGVYLVELAALQDPALVARTAAHTLGVHEQADQPVTTTLVHHLGQRSLLLVLDNCEHLRTACLDLIGALLADCPRLHVLATSRHAIGRTGERVYRVPPLVLPEHVVGKKTDASLVRLGTAEAVRLFVERAAAVLPGFEMLSARHDCSARPRRCASQSATSCRPASAPNVRRASRQPARW